MAIPANDEQIRCHAEQPDFSRDEIFGIYNRRLELIAMAHPAFEHLRQALRRKFGVSVLKHARGQWFPATACSSDAVMHARNAGVNMVFIPPCLKTRPC